MRDAEILDSLIEGATYRLIADVANPNADGRSRGGDFSKAATFPRGTQFLVASVPFVGMDQRYRVLRPLVRHSVLHELTARHADVLREMLPLLELQKDSMRIVQFHCEDTLSVSPWEIFAELGIPLKDIRAAAAAVNDRCNAKTED